MEHTISTLRNLSENLLALIGLGPRRSPFMPARNRETRVRFAQYVSRTQPTMDAHSIRRTTRFLGDGGALSRGVVRHAALQETPASHRVSGFRFVNHTGSSMAVRRRARAEAQLSGFRMLLHALRVR